MGGFVPVGLCHQLPRKNLFKTCGGVRGMGKHFEISSVVVKAFMPLGTDPPCGKMIGREGGSEIIIKIQRSSKAGSSLGLKKGEGFLMIPPSFHICFALPGCLNSFLFFCSQVVEVPCVPPPPLHPNPISSFCVSF